MAEWSGIERLKWRDEVVDGLVDWWIGGLLDWWIGGLVLVWRIGRCMYARQVGWMVGSRNGIWKFGMTVDKDIHQVLV